MQRHVIFAAGFILACLFTFGCVSKSKYLRQVSEADQLKAKNNALWGEKDSLMTQLADLAQQKKALDENLNASKAENEKLLGSLEAKKGELTQRIAELSRENQTLSQKLRETEQAKDAEINRLKGTYEQLVGSLKDEIQAGQIKITQLAGRLSVNMVDKILFASGEATVKPEGQKVLQHVGEVLKKVADKDIRIEGHTDNIPISPSLKDRFASNWELSTARATAVVRYLQDKAGIAPNRLIAAGYGEHRPIAPNDTPLGREQNRRIEIVLVPSETAAAVPAVPAPPK
jgi:chemotaxis protein MotB